ncbi:hypothetical protein IAQ61_004419 [Plenodomus lingam]|uniref:DUF1294 domain-containing protein n=1 Tax=Leptosphaeria maculans (strain JN3 / isolate v23.1.3 / race Av1-4-5-6-7-8) TaxID=985895 RepID=E4ZVG6_LEPMJ|nr:hypothetical protein LEMA_P027440.1 [Plenodomus lingam JN3]KAH9873792.1 hypothetical protein IAQ61_004419 [Plenodomus lingam]CBX95592.1 hypothetical protein LEMA_P027440.1 [Plenodomus lingam JN3]
MPPNRARARYRPWTVATAAGVSSLVLPGLTLARLFAASHSPYPMAYAGLVSSVTFVFFGYDKMQARNLNWRVKELTLHGLALAGGWPGALAGMHYFQHKTRKTDFQVLFWGIVLLWEALSYAVWQGLV